MERVNRTRSGRQHGITDLRQALHALLLLLAPATVLGAGTPAGTLIENTATMTFDLNGSQVTLQSNTATITVQEIVDVDVTVQSGQVLVAANDSNRALLFRLTNTGNGTETF